MPAFGLVVAQLSCVYFGRAKIIWLHIPRFIHKAMKTKERIFIYVIGVAIGMVLVSVLISRRSEKAKQAVDPWVLHNRDVIDAGAAEPLPSKLPDVLQAGMILDFGYLPSGSEVPQARVWLMNFKDSYPYVRVVEQLSDGAIEYMAADQILIVLKPGIDVTELKPILDTLGLRVRMFNRKEHILVVGVISTEIDAVDQTIELLRPWSEKYSSISPDFIRLQPKKAL
jgi:hypothetical protein